MKKIKKVMLIFPPTTRPKEFSAEVVKVSAFFPLGLGYLAAVLEKQGKYEISILDALAEGDIFKGIELNGGTHLRYGLTDEEIESRIRKEAPDVIAASCMFGPMEEDMSNVCRIAKKINPEITTIVGGHHVSNQPVPTLQKFLNIDFVVEGEGEDTLLQILSELEGNQNFEPIDGLTFRDGQSIKTKKKYHKIKDLDSIPFPARHLFNMQRYFEIANPHGYSAGAKYYTQMVNTRGCPCKCTFCTLAAPDGLPAADAQRRRSVPNILEEMEMLIKEYGIQEFHFEDDNLTANKVWAEELFDGMIERKFNISWHVPSGLAAYTLSDRILKKMKESGCDAITIAIESGNQDVLNKLMRKPMQLKYIPQLVKDIRKNDIDVRAFFLLGFPGETKENMRETVEFAKSIELDWCYFSAVSPLPGTRIHDICVEKKYIDLETFDYLTSFNRSIVNTEEFTAEWVNQFREEAIIDVCFRNNVNLLKYNVDKAIDNFKSVVKSYPHFDFANFYLGEAYLRKGDNKSAVDSYRNALIANPEHIEAKQRLIDLEESSLVHS